MANEKQLKLLMSDVKAWNKWRVEHPNVKIDLKKAYLPKTILREADLREANLREADLWKADLRKAKLMGAILSEADLREANLTEANLWKADLRKADLRKTKLMGASLSEADLIGADLIGAKLKGANLSKAKLKGANLMRADLSDAYLFEADLIGADLSETNLSAANLLVADLREANLSGALLINTSLIKTKIDNAIISNSKIYGVNVWDLEGEFKEQNQLIITEEGAPVITVDNIKVAQFVHLILNNAAIRDVLNTLTSKTVLILGRFIPERKVILEALRNKLREFDLLPILFDFDRPLDKDITETIKTLAGLCYFVIADVTNPKSSPLELQATVPDYQIPFVPIIQEGESPFAMMVDLQKKYDWVLEPVEYDSLETLMAVLKDMVIDPAIQKHNELQVIKASKPTIRSAKDFLKQKQGEKNS